MYAARVLKLVDQQHFGGRGCRARDVWVIAEAVTSETQHVSEAERAVGAPPRHELGLYPREECVGSARVGVDYDLTDTFTVS